MTRGVPSNQTREGWWYRASQEEKLAQIDGAIEIGMTARQCAMNCGAHINDKHRKIVVADFAKYHGRHFGDSDAHIDKKSLTSKRMHRKKRQFASAKAAYENGEPVDFWSVE